MGNDPHQSTHAAMTAVRAEHRAMAEALRDARTHSATGMTLEELAKALEEANAANAASEVALQRAKRNLETEHRKGVEAAAKLLRRVRSLCYHTGPHDRVGVVNVVP
jgi:hypothetical protein